MGDGNLQLVDTVSGELLDRDFRSLDDIAAETRGLLDALDRDEWQIGSNLAEAFGKLNGDKAAYGKWCSDNLSEYETRQLHRYRTRFDVFGHRREEVAHIPKSAQYLLAAPDAEEYRELVVDALKDAEDVSVQDVREEMREARKRLKPPIPETAGAYNVIVIDPPWEMEKIEREIRPNQIGFDYPTMNEDELSAMNLPAADDCHLFCWTTHKHLPMALRLLDAWGFRYVLTMVWHKPGGFQPIGLPQYNCEFAVYGRKGSPKFIDTKAFNACFEAPRREHSRKPDEFYDVIRRVTGGSRIDMFSRENRDGFASWGNEAGKFAA
jgi:N6-adenosine-specific RNA methylase IME4